MGDRGEENKSRVLRVERVRGEPYHIGGRTLVPVARIASAGRARATVSNSRFGGWSWGLTRVTPVAMVVHSARGERSIAIYDSTGRAVARMALNAVAVCLLLAVIRRLAYRSQTR